MNNAKPIVIYTAIIGNVDRLRRPAHVLPGAHYVCFTDQPMPSDVFEIRTPPFSENDPQLLARRLKLFPHLLFPDHDASLWIDGAEEITGDLMPLIHAGFAQHDMACFAHPKRECLFDEGEHCAREGRYDAASLEKQMARYRAERMPTQAGLYNTSMLLRRHTPSVIATMERWWDEVQQGPRDQVSLPYVLHKTRQPVEALDYRIWHKRCFRRYPHLIYKEGDLRSRWQARLRMWFEVNCSKLRISWLYRLSLKALRAIG